jgi:3-methyladenine DNA glycosylase AlkC
MAAFKDEVGARVAARLAAELAVAWPAFPRRRFTHRLPAELEPLELMARVRFLADRLAVTLPDAFADAADVLWRALESPTFTGWMTLPCSAFVASRGIDEPDVALPLLAGLTPRFSSEAALRPFLERHPPTTYEHLDRWVADDDEHVRRLVSEGTRPRLPWATRVRALLEDPTPNVPLLDRLVDDPSPYVRRSVANHLNDVAKDHPDLALDLARRWLGRGDAAAAVVRHGLRGLVKAGDAAALDLVGATTGADIRLDALTVDPAQVAIGETAELSFTLTLDERHAGPADAVVDYRVHYVGARGVKAPKVFKLARRRLEPGHPVAVTRRHAFRDVSIRRIRPGPHTVDVQVNGRVLGSVTVDVVPTRCAGPRSPG